MILDILIWLIAIFTVGLVIFAICSWIIGLIRGTVSLYKQPEKILVIGKTVLQYILGFAAILFFLLISRTIVGEFKKRYVLPHKERLEFLQTNCQLIDIGYEILNDGKSTYKCPNGKEYQEANN